jgi:hypothetical protein
MFRIASRQKDSKSSIRLRVSLVNLSDGVHGVVSARGEGTAPPT